MVDSSRILRSYQLLDTIIRYIVDGGTIGNILAITTLITYKVKFKILKR